MDPLRLVLSGGDRRSVGRVHEVVQLLRNDPSKNPELVALLWDSDVIVRMRSADALEKLSRDQPEMLAPFKAELLGLMVEATQQELRWHLALMAPRLTLNPKERLRVAGILEGYLEDRSSIVKTCAMQALWELSSRDSEIRARVVETIHMLTRTGTAAMRARGRKLLKSTGSETR